ncbi:MAG: beta/gamma crystallin-related protein [Xenococcaceae cyanobacterium MO_188.B32]|nr:beta/gamma crystallin-related protein [Xenococcaceae cyanobacterium MO_188.B32]
MSNIDKMTANEQLFTELTPKESAVVEGGYATIYRHINRQGGGITRYSLDSNLVNDGFNDEASSITVSKGEVWQLFEHINYTGQFRFVPEGTWNLTDLGFNDKLSSLRRVV